MIIVFAAFIPSNVVLIKTLALGLTVAVFLDATLIRSALVPACNDAGRTLELVVTRTLCEVGKAGQFES